MSFTTRNELDRSSIVPTMPSTVQDAIVTLANAISVIAAEINELRVRLALRVEA